MEFLKYVYFAKMEGDGGLMCQPTQDHGQISNENVTEIFLEK